ncbi:hypothetical protein D3C86_1854340 [compost metagenome]
MHLAVFGIAATGNQGADAIANGIILHTNAGGDHHASDLQARDIRCAGRRCVLAAALQHVRAVNPGGGDLHQDLPLLQGRQRPLCDNQNFRFAGLADLNGFHGAGQLRVRRHDDSPRLAFRRSDPSR